MTKPFISSYCHNKEEKYSLEEDTESLPLNFELEYFIILLLMQTYVYFLLCQGWGAVSLSIRSNKLLFTVRKWLHYFFCAEAVSGMKPSKQLVQAHSRGQTSAWNKLLLLHAVYTAEKNLSEN